MAEGSYATSARVKRDSGEEWWAERYEFLKEQGYMLRPRYRPGWKASFTRIREANNSEDGQLPTSDLLMDALRISDSSIVAIKRVRNSLASESKLPVSEEERITRLFSDEKHATNPSNHCIRVLQVLHVPGFEGETLLVLPWMRAPDDPPFRTIGEVLHFLKEIFEGIQYMHQNNVAHRDCSINNMVMDARKIYPGGFHPHDPSRTYDWKKRAQAKFSRTRRPPRYYLIDFGFSEIYEPSKPRPLTHAIRSGGYEPPEAQPGMACDPFATDVFFIGNMIRIRFLDGETHFDEYGIYGLEFLRPLVDDMTRDDPSKRPTMDEIIARFSDIVRSLPSSKLRSRAVKRDESPLRTPFRAFKHLFWTYAMILERRPAIPSP